MAKSWVEQLEELGDFLRGALLGGCGPSSSFLEAVRQKGLASEWNKFRTDRIRNLFDVALTAKTIPLSAKRALVVGTAGAPPKTMHQPSAAQQTESIRFREIILAAVHKMSDEELRKLAIPVGYIADSFEASSR